MNPVVRFTPLELKDLAAIGARRRCRAIELGRKNRHDLQTGPELWAYDIRGAIGEAAVAKHFNRYWNGYAGDLKLAHDVGKSLHVRTADPGRRLIVHKDDPDDGVFILVTGYDLEWTLIGWLLGWEAKQDQFWDVRRRCPAYFVEQSALHPISKLTI